MGGGRVEERRRVRGVERKGDERGGEGLEPQSVE